MKAFWITFSLNVNTAQLGSQNLFVVINRWAIAFGEVAPIAQSLSTLTDCVFLSSWRLIRVMSFRDSFALLIRVYEVIFIE